MKLPRSQGGVDPSVRAQMDRFVEGLCLGLGTTQAAVFAGVNSRSAMRTGYKYRTDPYVRARFAELREKMSRDEICSFAELALNVKSIAFDELAANADRLRASKIMANLMGHNAPTKIAPMVNAGVLLLPVAESMEAWEKQAMSAQAALQKEVEADAT